MIDRPVACFGGSGTEVFQNENPHRAGTPAYMANGLDMADQPVHILSLTPADLGQRVP